MAIIEKNGGCLAIDHRPEARTPHLTYFLAIGHILRFCLGTNSWSKSVGVIVFGIFENCHSWLFLTKMGVEWTFIMVQRIVHLTNICFLAIGHIIVFLVETSSLSKINRCWPLVIFKMIVHAYFRQKWVVLPLIINQRLIHLTPHMFPCHMSHSWICTRDQFLVKYS
jgi:hypothetical protein